jgi:hypothetical protein
MEEQKKSHHVAPAIIPRKLVFDCSGPLSGEKLRQSAERRKVPFLGDEQAFDVDVVIVTRRPVQLLGIARLVQSALAGYVWNRPEFRFIGVEQLRCAEKRHECARVTVTRTYD